MFPTNTLEVDQSIAPTAIFRVEVDIKNIIRIFTVIVLAN
jgi:hypothetical protein